MFAIPPSPYTLITMYGSDTWATLELICVRTVPSTFQKKVTEQPSVNHIGSSTSHQWGIHGVQNASKGIHLGFESHAGRHQKSKNEYE